MVSFKQIEKSKAMPSIILECILWGRPIEVACERGHWDFYEHKFTVIVSKCKPCTARTIPSVISASYDQNGLRKTSRNIDRYKAKIQCMQTKSESKWSITIDEILLTLPDFQPQITLIRSNRSAHELHLLHAYKNAINDCLCFIRQKNNGLSSKKHNPATYQVSTMTIHW